MYHQYLERQIKKYLGDTNITDDRINQLLHTISNTYAGYERDRELNEHVFAINEQEYQVINNRLQQFNLQLESKVQERTKELEDIAQFPIENPNPIFRVSMDGNILFFNPAAKEIKHIQFQGRAYTINKFFSEQVKKIKDSGTFDLNFKDIQYLFYYKKIEGKNYINFYGADITEKNKLRDEAQENFKKLNNFLESTADVYYIIHQKNHKKNLLTNQWKQIFGFDGKGMKDIFIEKSTCVISESPKLHYSRIKKLKAGESINILYQAKNKETGISFWLSESIIKQYDEQINDIVISGRITDVTSEQLHAMKIAESEGRFRNFMDSVPVMVWVSNENNIVTYSNKASKSFLGYALEKLKDYREYKLFIHPEDRKTAIDQWRKCIKTKKEIISQYRLKNAKGIYHNILEKAVPRFYEDGQFAGYIGAYFDLTKEKESQQNLLLEKQKHELLTQNSPDIIFLTNQDGIIEFVSPTAQRILGYRADEMIKKHINKFICKECLTQLNTLSWLKKLPKNPRKLEYRMKKKNGELLWIESAMTTIKNGTVAGQKILMHNRDIDSIKHAEEILIQNEQKYRGLFENMHLGVMEVDLNDKIQWVNRSFERLTGYKLTFLKGKNAYDLFLNSSVSKQIMKNVANVRKEKADSIYEVKMKKNDGVLIDVVISGSPIIDIQGNVRGSIGIHWDVTDIRKMEKMIEEEKILRQKEVMQATLNAEEQQREILGNELHDGVGHILTYTSLFLQMASDSDKGTSELFNKAHTKVEQALNEVRRISRSLIPPALIDLGLKEAIIELFNQYIEIDKLKFKIECNDSDIRDIDFNVQRNIYRIIQELLNNTVKHANASTVNLIFRRTSSKLYLEYFDNGIGFDINKVKKGVGLRSIENRAYFYGGTTQIKSGKYKGTHYIFELPLKNIINNRKKRIHSKKVKL